MSLLRWIDVDLNAVRHNFRAVRKLVGPKVRISAVVKSDAYGLGAVAVSRAVLDEGADGLAVAYLDEAAELRKARIKAPLLVMGAVLPEQAPEALSLRVAVMADNAALLASLQKAAGRARKVPVHVKVNLGLSRWGLALADLIPFLRELKKYPSVRLEGVFAHPGYMAGKNALRVEEGLRNLLFLLKPIVKDNPSLDVHVADSAVLMDFPEFACSRVRIGNLLYGINPSKKSLPLQNPWKVFSRLVHMESLTAGQAVGYGGEFTATRSMRVGTVPVGYSHGLTLEPASRWIHLAGGQSYWGTVRGVKCPLVGRVGMSHCLIDLSNLPDPVIGETVQLPLRRTASSNWVKVHKG